MQFDHWNLMVVSGWREENTHFLWQKLVLEEVSVLQNILCQVRKKKSHNLTRVQPTPKARLREKGIP